MNLFPKMQYGRAWAVIKITNPFIYYIQARSG